jgi:uncharacterized BrkB/YihY/UPF0761 family membrane protein
MTNGTPANVTPADEIKMRYVMRLYFLIVLIMGITIISVIGITGYVMIKDIGLETAQQVIVPDGLIAIGSASVGALAGLLVPSPRHA